LTRSDSNHNYAEGKKGGKEIDQIIVDPGNAGIKGGAVITAMDFSFRDFIAYRTELLCLDGCSQKAAQEAGKKILIE
jgi:hypothetical protein